MKYPTLAIFCPACEQKVYILIALLKRGEAPCPKCGVATKATSEFLA
jgi:hypothetical protein